MQQQQQQQQDAHSPLFVPEVEEEQESGPFVDLLQLFLSSPSTTTAEQCHDPTGHDDDDDNNNATTPTMLANTPRQKPSASRHGHSSNALYSTSFMLADEEEPIVDLQQHQRSFNSNNMSGIDSFDDVKKQEPTEQRSHSSRNSNVTAASTGTDLNTVNLDDDDISALFLTPAQHPKPSSTSAGVASMSRIINGFTDTFGTSVATTPMTLLKNPTDSDRNSSIMYAQSSSHDSSNKENEEHGLTSPSSGGFTNTPSPTNMMLGIVIDSAPVLLTTNHADSDSSSSSGTMYPKSHSSKEEEDMMMSPMTDVSLAWHGSLLAPKPKVSSVMMANKTKRPGVLQPENQEVLPTEIAIFNKKKNANNKLSLLERKVERLDKKVTLLQTSITEIHAKVMQSLLGMTIKMAPIDDTSNHDLVLEKRLEGMALALEKALRLTKERFDRLEEQKQTVQATAVIVLVCLVGILLTNMIR